MIDSIEAHVESAAVHVEEGNVQLGTAEQYQRKARKKMFFLAGIGVVALIILILIIYFSVKDWFEELRRTSFRGDGLDFIIYESLIMIFSPNGFMIHNAEWLT